MGMGTWGITEYTISREKLHDLLPEQVEEVEAINPDIWHIMARGLQGYTDPLHITEDDKNEVLCEMSNDILYYAGDDYDMVEVDCHQAFKKLQNLCHDFNLVTGLVLNLTYYDEEMGDRYDDVEHTNGCVFTLEGVTQLTPEAMRCRHLFNRQSWTCSG